VLWGFYFLSDSAEYEKKLDVQLPLWSKIRALLELSKTECKVKSYHPGVVSYSVAQQYGVSHQPVKASSSISACVGIHFFQRKE